MGVRYLLDGESGDVGDARSKSRSARATVAIKRISAPEVRSRALQRFCRRVGDRAKRMS
jgi:hypothetical protein